MSQRWYAPTDLDEALGLLLEDDDAVMVAGGVSVVLFMNVGFMPPVDLISLAGIRDLYGVVRSETEVVIGAMETHARLADNAILRALSPATTEMFSGIANLRVRNWGTVGGNLAHADPAQDPPVMLTALGASVDVVGPVGERSVLVERLADGPLSLTIAENEIITRVRIPVPANEGLRTRYIKFLPGTKDDYATVSVAAALQLDDGGSITDVRLAAGSVGPTVIPLTVAAELLRGQVVDPDVLAAVADAVRDEVRPRSDRRGSADYKREMAGVMAARAIEACTAARSVEAAPRRGTSW